MPRRDIEIVLVTRRSTKRCTLFLSNENTKPLTLTYGRAREARRIARDRKDEDGRGTTTEVNYRKGRSAGGEGSTWRDYSHMYLSITKCPGHLYLMT